MTAAKKKQLEAVEDDEQPASEFVEIVYKDTTFVVPRDRDDWPTEGLAYLAEQRFNLFVKSMLEIAKPGQWDQVCRLCPTRRDFNTFFEAFGEAINKECVG